MPSGPWRYGVGMSKKIAVLADTSIGSRKLLMALAVLTLCALLMPLRAAHGQPADAPAEKSGIAGLTRTEGYVPFYFDGARGRVLLEVPVFDQDVLYYVSAATNPGSVEAPFDRGIIFSSVIHFERSGGKVVVNQINLAYRATHGSAKTQEGVADSFPTSVLAVLPVVSEANGKVIVDGTSLFMRDAGDIVDSFKR